MLHFPPGRSAVKQKLQWSFPNKHTFSAADLYSVDLTEASGANELDAASAAPTSTGRRSRSKEAIQRRHQKRKLQLRERNRTRDSERKETREQVPASRTSQSRGSRDDTQSGSSRDGTGDDAELRGNAAPYIHTGNTMSLSLALTAAQVQRNNKGKRLLAVFASHLHKVGASGYSTCVLCPSRLTHRCEGGASDTRAILGCMRAAVDSM